MEARGALGRPFWDPSPLMTPIFITWTIPGHFFLVRAVPGAVPTAAASMDGSDGRPDGIPGTGKGLITGGCLSVLVMQAATGVSRAWSCVRDVGANTFGHHNF